MEETTASVLEPAGAEMPNAEQLTAPIQEAKDACVKIEKVEPTVEDEQNAAPSLFSQV